MHGILRYLTAAVASVCIPAAVFAIPDKPYPARLVNDFAGILNISERLSLEQRLTAFDDSTSNQITVVTVNDLEGYSPAEYGTEIGMRWKVGSDRHDNGIVVLVKPKTAESSGEVNISVGYGLEGAIPDSYAKRIIENEMIPAFRQGNYYLGINDACTVLMKLASGEISDPSEDGSSSDGLAALFAFIVFIIIMSMAFGGRHRRGGGGGNSGRGDSDSRSKDIMKGIIIGSLLSGNHSGGNSDSDRGGFGGGGFGGFGGGDFGGGGASGKW